MANELTAKIVISNNKELPHVVYIEPYPDDFTLLAKEKLTIHAWSSTSTPQFEILEGGWATAVYISDSEAEYRVEQSGVALQPGHNREAAINAGFYV